MSNIAIYISLFAFTLVCFIWCLVQVVNVSKYAIRLEEAIESNCKHHGYHDNRLKELEKRAGIDYSRPETNVSELRGATPSEKEYLLRTNKR